MPQFTHSLKSELSFYGFESVNLITGAVIYEGIDFCISGIVPLEWKRIWYSDSSYIGMFGHGEHTLFDSHLITFEEENCIGLVLEDGRVCGFEFLYNDEEYYSREERLTLRKSNEGFRIRQKNNTDVQVIYCMDVQKIENQYWLDFDCCSPNDDVEMFRRSDFYISCGDCVVRVLSYNDSA